VSSKGLSGQVERWLPDPSGQASSRDVRRRHRRAGQTL